MVNASASDWPHWHAIQIKFHYFAPSNEIIVNGAPLDNRCNSLRCVAMILCKSGGRIYLSIFVFRFLPVIESASYRNRKSAPGLYAVKQTSDLELKKIITIITITIIITTKPT